MSACCSSCTASRWWPWLLPRTRWHCGTPGQWRLSSTFQRQLCVSLKLSSCSWAWASWLSKCGSADQCFENQSLLLTSESRVLKCRYVWECGWIMMLWKGNLEQVRACESSSTETALYTAQYSGVSFLHIFYFWNQFRVSAWIIHDVLVFKVLV